MTVPGFEIAGYPRELLDAFSSRRREILAWLDAHGLPWSAALTQQAALITRKRKVDKDLDTLKTEWKARAEGIAHDRGLARRGHERDRRQSRKTSRSRPYVRTEEELRPEPPGLSVREVVWRAVEHLAERASVFRESDIRAIALSHAPVLTRVGETVAERPREFRRHQGDGVHSGESRPIRSQWYAIFSARSRRQPGRITDTGNPRGLQCEASTPH